MVVICYLLNKLSPIVNLLGLLGLFGGIFICDNCWRITGDDTVSYICTCSDAGIAIRMYVITIVLAVVGFIFGIFAHKNDIPPRWSWSKSRNSLFEFSVAAVFGYAVNVAMWSPAVYMIKFFINLFNNA